MTNTYGCTQTLTFMYTQEVADTVASAMSVVQPNLIKGTVGRNTLLLYTEIYDH